MPTRLQKGTTYADGDVVNAANLNDLVDEGIALEGFISELGSASAAGADEALILKAGVLKRAAVSTFPGAGTVTNVSSTLPVAGTFLLGVTDQTTTPVISLALAQKHANLFLASAVSGGGLTTPAFRAITPADLPSSTVHAIAAGAIDCTLGTVFKKTLPVGSPFNMTINDLADGQTIMVRIINNAAGNNHISWAVDSGTIVWRGSSVPVVTQSANARDIFVFTKVDSLTYGHADQNFTT